jgi:hypothetical protein
MTRPLPPGFRFAAAVAGLASLLCAAAEARAQRSLRIKALQETPLPFVSTVIAPAARIAAVSDVASVLVIAHQPESTVHLSFFKLDAQGLPVAGDPQTVVLPKPAAHAARKTLVLGMLCHPRFPLLHVWHDVEPKPDGGTLDQAQVMDFDHLLVYTLDEPQPRLLLATARGADYACGNLHGGFALDIPARRLYVPNLRLPGPMKNFVGAIGWITLDPDGLPAPAAPQSTGATNVSVTVAGGGIVTPPAVASTPPLDPAAAAAARAAKLAAGYPAGVRLNAESAQGTVGDWPCPYSYAPINDQWVMLSLYAGISSWMLDERLGRYEYMYVQPHVPYRFRIAVHPTLPQVYLNTVTYDGHLLRFEHADGYLTLVPQSLYIDSSVPHSPPLVILERNQLAFGAAGKVCLVDLDAQGKFKPSGVQMTVNNPKLSAIDWSKRFGRLYAAVEKTP